MKRIILFGIIIGLMLLTSCRDKELDMTVLTKTLQQDTAIEALTVEDAWNVTVVQDEERNDVELEYSAFLEDYIQIKREGARLAIGFSQRLNLPAATVKNATVYVQSFQEISLKEASTVALEGTFTGFSFDLSLQEASVLRGGDLVGIFHAELAEASTIVDLNVEGDSCQLALNGASVFKGSLAASERLEVNANGASRVTTYGGNATKANAMLNDASFLNLLNTEVNDLYVEMHDLSEASVRATNRIEGLLRDASKLYYSGNPVLNVDCDDISILQQIEYPNP